MSRYRHTRTALSSYNCRTTPSCLQLRKNNNWIDCRCDFLKPFFLKMIIPNMSCICRKSESRRTRARACDHPPWFMNSYSSWCHEFVQLYSCTVRYIWYIYEYSCTCTSTAESGDPTVLVQLTSYSREFQSSMTFLAPSFLKYQLPRWLHWLS